MRAAFKRGQLWTGAVYVALLSSCSKQMCCGSNAAKITSDIGYLTEGIQGHAHRVGRLPRDWPDLLSRWPNDRLFGKERALPLDPWHHPYLLITSESQQQAVVGTLGEYGAPGGEGDAADRFELVPP